MGRVVFGAGWFEPSRDIQSARTRGSRYESPAAGGRHRDQRYVAGLTYCSDAVVGTIQQVIGAKLGSYEVVSKIGEGGMGTVYLAKHHLLGRKAAVKVLLPELCRKKDVIERFFNEARAATLIQHGGIVDVFDFGVAGDDSAYLVMEFLDGESLSDRMARLGKMPQADAVRLGRQAASALAAAHREGIIHRDLKPDNIFIVPDSEVAGGERIKILDFGIAKLTSEDPASSKRTRTGMIMGTPDYMSPEQCLGAGGDFDGRVDVYALGCVIYQMLCGRPPFAGAGSGEVIAKHIYESPPPPRTHAYQISEALESLILTCLAKDPNERFGSMDALVGAFDNLSHRRLASVSDALPPTAETVVADPAAVRTPPAAEPTGGAAPRGPGAVATTLRGSTGEVESRAETAASHASRRKPFAVMGAIAVVIGGISAVAIAFIGSGEGGDEVAAAGSAEHAEPDESAKADAGVQAEAEFDGAPSPEPEKVVFDIQSEPAGAVVQDDSGALVGVTPLEIEVEKDGEITVFTVRAPHYEEAEIELVADEDREKQLALEREPGADPDSSPARAQRQAPATQRRDRPAPREQTDADRREEAEQPDEEGDEGEEGKADLDPFGSPR